MSDETKNDLPIETEGIADKITDVVTDFVSDTTVPPPIRKGFTAACKRLGTAMVEGAAGYFERRSTEKWAETQARVKIIEEAGSQIRHQIKVDPEFPQRASYTFAKQILREQFNREQVLGMTAGMLKEKKYDNSENQEADTQAEQTISEDWFNIFEKEASQKSSEDMQHRFAKVLAGEIEKPGSHSMKAVKVLGDMDQSTAELFQKVCSMSVVFEDFFDKSVYDIRVPSLGGDPGQNDLQKYGLSFGQINMLIEYELIAPNYSTQYSYQTCILDKEKNVANSFRHQGRYWILKPSPERSESNEFRLKGVQLSYVGFQLFHIVEQIPAQQYSKDLKEFFEKQNLQMAEVIIRDRNAGWHIVQR